MDMTLHVENQSMPVLMVTTHQLLTWKQPDAKANGVAKQFQLMAERATQMTDTLLSIKGYGFEGYDHSGLND